MIGLTPRDGNRYAGLGGSMRTALGLLLRSIRQAAGWWLIGAIGAVVGAVTATTTTMAICGCAL